MQIEKDLLRSQNNEIERMAIELNKARLENCKMRTLLKFILKDLNSKIDPETKLIIQDLIN